MPSLLPTLLLIVNQYIDEWRRQALLPPDQPFNDGAREALVSREKVAPTSV